MPTEKEIKEKEAARKAKAAQQMQRQQGDTEKNASQSAQSDTEKNASQRPQEDVVNQVKEVISKLGAKYNTDVKHSGTRKTGSSLEIEFNDVADRSGAFFRDHQPEILEALVASLGTEFEVEVSTKGKGMFMVSLTSK